MKVLVIEGLDISEVDFDEYDIDSCIHHFGPEYDDFTVMSSVQDWSCHVTITITDDYIDRTVHFVLRKDIVENCP